VQNFDCPPSRAIPAPERQLLAFTTNPRSALTATVNGAGDIDIRRLGSDKPLTSNNVDMNSAKVNIIHISSDGRLIVATGRNVLHIIDIERNSKKTIDTLPDTAIRVDTDPSSSRVLLVTAQGKVVELDHRTGETQNFSHTSKRTSALVLQDQIADAKYLGKDFDFVYVAHDGTLNKWSRARGMAEGLFPGRGSLAETADSIGRRLFFIELSESQKLIASASSDTFMVYDTRKGKNICYRRLPAREIRAIRFAPNERFLIASVDSVERQFGETVLFDIKFCTEIGPIVLYGPKYIEIGQDGQHVLFLQDGVIDAVRLPFPLDREIRSRELLKILARYRTGNEDLNISH
jgi:WD40 repeat protein